MKHLIISCICAAVFVTYVTDAAAQDNKALRTHTWSAYAQGGVSWATGLDYKNIDNSTGTSIAPQFGAGIDFNLRPWVRFGLNWEISKYVREQRFREFQPVAPSFGNPDEGFSQLTSSYGGIAYGRMWTRYNNLDLTAEFNVMDLWPSRKCKRFNLYAGLGAGIMFAKGNTYTLGMGREYWTDPNNKDANGNVINDNWSSTAWVKATNDRHGFNAFYIPVLLSAEYDISPRVTLGLKGEYKAVLSNRSMAPNGIETLSVVFRYNILGEKHGVRSNKRKYQEAMASYGTLKKEYEALQSQHAASAADARDAERNYRTSTERLNAENEALKRSLQDCQNSHIATPEIVTVHFDRGMSNLSEEEMQRLTDFAGELQSHEDVSISLTGEASADGQTRANQRLSEKRLKNVMSVLNENGIDSSRIRSARAIGDANRVFNASSRRVEIVVHK